ncbi:hypothetical protein [Alicyclobacillus sp. SO9]|uniref:hypothetical protein n=1 Tax=Alicyclobacillus sp. SO9 TaxID=2665646 RepID=UPI0018E830A7|nr:hypothetical protein [Alicyclobacillus sp. SO9]QQE80331.1 hypothetical protein GI364_07885 [Alicyclobacillus sp. SO9]
MKTARSFALMLLGIVIGSSLMLSAMGRQLQNSYEQQKKLSDKVSELEQEKTALEDRLHKPNQQPMIERIHVDVLGSEGGVTEIRTIDFVKQQLAWLINKPLSLLVTMPDLPVKMVDGRTFHIEQKEMIVHVKTVTVGETLYLRVTSTEVKSTQGS